MKTFKQFITESKTKKKPAPMAVIDFGNRKRKPKPAMAVIDFIRKKPIKESWEDDYNGGWFDHHSENKHLGSEINKTAQSRALHASQKNNELGEHTKAYSKWSADLNGSLLKHAKEGKEHPTEFEDSMHKFHLGELDKELHEHKLEHPLHVFSGVGFHPQELASQHPEGHVHLPAYTSTSIDKSVARDFAGTAGFGKGERSRHIIHMELPKGHPGKYLGRNSENSSESEFMLPRNMKIKIHPEPKVVSSYGHDYHIHKATVVPHDD